MLVNGSSKQSKSKQLNVEWGVNIESFDAEWLSDSSIFQIRIVISANPWLEYWNVSSWIQKPTSNKVWLSNNETLDTRFTQILYAEPSALPLEITVVLPNQTFFSKTFKADDIGGTPPPTSTTTTIASVLWGIVVVLLIVGVGFLVFYYYKKRKLQELFDAVRNRITAEPAPGPGQTVSIRFNNTPKRKSSIPFPNLASRSEMDGWEGGREGLKGLMSNCDVKNDDQCEFC